MQNMFKESNIKYFHKKVGNRYELEIPAYLT